MDARRGKVDGVKISMQRIAVTLCLTGILVACGGSGKKDETADEFAVRANEELAKSGHEGAMAAWVQLTYITPDTEALAARASERVQEDYARLIRESKAFDGKDLSENAARTIKLLKLGLDAPAPDDPAKRAELSEIETRMLSVYGSGKYCPSGPESCKNFEQLAATLAKSRNPDELLATWRGWHEIAKPIRKDYQRFVELANEGARGLEYANVGDLWRSGYDMAPADFENETDRLWSQVKPLYDGLHCYARGKLQAKYGKELVPDGKPVPAHLFGNMWAQQWNNIYDLLEPYSGVSNLDVTSELKKQGYDAVKMTRSAESFYTLLGFPELPQGFWERSMLTRPRDREVDCYASAWDIDSKGDVRIKMCIDTTEQDLYTIYHELGHIYYDLSYMKQPYLYQSGAHDGFHEAIGDTINLSMTEGYLAGIGLLPKGMKSSREALINRQMKVATEKIAFLPFGKLVDQWRWGVFSGAIPPEKYNEAWWDLRRKYQGGFRPRREIPRAPQHPVHAILPVLRTAVPVPPRALRAGGVQGAAARMLDIRQRESGPRVPGDARARRQQALAGCARKTDGHAADGRDRDCGILSAADGLARRAESRPRVRLVRTRRSTS
jgi:peptidyl-dipeptidase A